MDDHEQLTEEITQKIIKDSEKARTERIATGSVSNLSKNMWGSSTKISMENVRHNLKNAKSRNLAKKMQQAKPNDPVMDEMVKAVTDVFVQNKENVKKSKLSLNNLSPFPKQERPQEQIESGLDVPTQEKRTIIDPIKENESRRTLPGLSRADTPEHLKTEISPDTMPRDRSKVGGATMFAKLVQAIASSSSESSEIKGPAADGADIALLATARKWKKKSQNKTRVLERLEKTIHENAVTEIPQVIYFDMVLEILPVLEKMIETYTADVGEKHHLTIAAVERCNMLRELINSSEYLKAKSDMASGGGFWAGRRKSRKFSVASEDLWKKGTPKGVTPQPSSTQVKRQTDLEETTPVINIQESGHSDEYSTMAEFVTSMRRVSIVEATTSPIKIKEEPVLLPQQIPETSIQPTDIQEISKTSVLPSPSTEEESAEDYSFTPHMGTREEEESSVKDHFELLKSIGSLTQINQPSKKKKSIPPAKPQIKKTSPRKEALLDVINSPLNNVQKPTRPRSVSVATASSKVPSTASTPKAQRKETETRVKQLKDSSPYRHK